MRQPSDPDRTKFEVDDVCVFIDEGVSSWLNVEVRIINPHKSFDEKTQVRTVQGIVLTDPRERRIGKTTDFYEHQLVCLEKHQLELNRNAADDGRKKVAPIRSGDDTFDPAQIGGES